MLRENKDNLAWKTWTFLQICLKKNCLFQPKMLVLENQWDLTESYCDAGQNLGDSVYISGKW